MCRLPTRLLAASLVACTLLACGGSGQPGGNPDGGQACERNRDCPSGMGCVQNVCVALPCGGCQPEEACSDNGTCVPAQGAPCPSAGCPAGYPCNGTVCAKPCTLDADCDKGFVCNSALGRCAQCTFNSQCAGVAGKPKCDSASGTCVACLDPIDCAPGSFCDTPTHSCKPGCRVNSDCNQSAGERCDGATSSTPGRCIQCGSDTECCPGSPPGSCPTPACDSIGHCVGCTSDRFCALGSPRCDLTTKTCVQCLPANNATGTDCGQRFYTGGPLDPHVEKTCKPETHSCVDGCEFDTQCGCPRDKDGKETNCPRYPKLSGSTVTSGEHCDPTKSTNGSLGTCVECLTGHNDHCRYRVKGSTEYAGAFALFNGGRCVSDVCVDGCDADADCTSGKICHLSASPGDPLNNKCVDCNCEGKTVYDNAWCADSAKCSGGKICDKSTLLCRKKRFNETCDLSGECGDVNDPAVSQPGSQCVPVPAICVKEFMPATTGPFTFCKDQGPTLGKCGIPCSDFVSNLCVADQYCPFSTTCRSARDTLGGTGKYCIPPKCR